MYNKYSKGSDGMVKEVRIKLAENPTWGGEFNHTIILNNKENTKFLDFLIV